MPPRTEQKPPYVLFRVSATILIVAALYFARGFFVPLALSILLSFILAPLVGVMERRGLPTVVGAVASVALALLVVGFLGYFVTTSVDDLVRSSDRYRENLKDRLRMLAGNHDSILDTVNEAKEKLEQVQKEVTEENGKEEGEDGKDGGEEGSGAASAPESAAAPPPEPEQKPVVVEMKKEKTPFLDRLQEYVSTVAGPLATIGIIIVFLLFFLIERRDLRDRVLRLLGDAQLPISTGALDEAARRVSRYLLMQLLVNLTYGIPVAIGLWIIGVPHALTWGLLATVLRFIPYLGPWIAAGMPILLSLAVFDGWAKPGMVAGLFICLELFSNNVMEPWLYGSSTGMTSVAVILAAVFWGWLWGAVGLLVAVPLTALLVVFGRYVPQLRIFTVLFGSEPALSPPQQLYHRLLAYHDSEALAIVEAWLERSGFLSLCDELLVPTLRLMKRDRHEGRLDPEQARALEDEFELILSEVISGLPEAEEEGAAARSGRRFLCLPARDRADVFVSEMLARLLRTRGGIVEVESPDRLVGELVKKAREADTFEVIVSALPPGDITRSIHLVKRLSTGGSKNVTVGLWGFPGDSTRARSRLAGAGARHLVFSLEECLQRLAPELPGSAAA